MDNAWFGGSNPSETYLKFMIICFEVELNIKVHKISCETTIDKMIILSNGNSGVAVSEKNATRSHPNILKWVVFILYLCAECNQIGHNS